MKYLKHIAIYQIIGGLIGLEKTFNILINNNIQNFGIVVIFSTLLILFIYSIFSGYLLLNKNQLKGINYSINNQLLQIFGFEVFGYAFHFTAGIYAGIKLNLTKDTVLSLFIGHTGGRININSNIEITEISFNILAIILVIYLEKSKNRITLTTLSP